MYLPCAAHATWNAFVSCTISLLSERGGGWYASDPTDEGPDEEACLAAPISVRRSALGRGLGARRDERDHEPTTGSDALQRKEGSYPQTSVVSSQVAYRVLHKLFRSPRSEHLSAAA